KVLHVGSPVPIDDAWWRQAVRRALGVRRPFLDAPDADRLGYRVINGENDGLPGLVVDRYAATLVLKLYSSAWFAHLAAVVPILLAETGCTGVVLRLARTVQRQETYGLSDGDVIGGDVPDGPVQFVEAGLTFEADVRAGQKTGHFLDQRANRVRVGTMAGGCDVLDVFSATGGFTVHAAAGGARSVLSVDRSAPTLRAVARNLALNGDLAAVRDCQTTTEAGDAFDVMARLAQERRRFDLVVVDPPSFAQRQADVAVAERAYARLTRSAVRLVARDGVLMQASCSSRVDPDRFFGAVLGAAEEAGARMTEIARTGHDVDHPIGFPQGGYLKAGFWRVRNGS
ncbi:MAG: class I SAM-dependent rRNA methyltransferase, partial [Ilumatobacteraceae bacterium]